MLPSAKRIQVARNVRPGLTDQTNTPLSTDKLWRLWELLWNPSQRAYVKLGLHLSKPATAGVRHPCKTLITVFYEYSQLQKGQELAVNFSPPRTQRAT